jgi:hypothetical protein
VGTLYRAAMVLGGYDGRKFVGLAEAGSGLVLVGVEVPSMTLVASMADDRSFGSLSPSPWVGDVPRVPALSQAPMGCGPCCAFLIVFEQLT